MSNKEIKNPMIGGVIAAKVPKDELPLPHLHFVAATDWIDKLGEKAFCGYLKLFTMAYQDEKTLKHDSAKISSSMEFARKEMKLGSKDTFYNRIIKPLWNYGLIDLVESGEVKSNVQKPLNILVYPYPKMEFKRMVMPLEKIRDYDLDYNSEARINANKISEIRNNQEENEALVQKSDYEKNPSPKNGLEENPSPKNGLEENLALVRKSEGNETLVRKSEGNETLVQKSDTLLKKEEELKEEEERREEGSADYLLDSKYLNLKNLAISVDYSEDEAMELVTLIHEKGIIDMLTDEIIMDSFVQVSEDLANGIVKWDLVKWTAGKLERNCQPKKVRLLRVPNGKGSNLTNKKGSRKNAGGGSKPKGRKEMIPDFMDEEKKAAKEAAKAAEPENPDLAEKARRLREMGIGINI